MGPVLPWAVAIGLQTWRDVKVYRRPPVPSEFVSSGLIFGGLTLVGGMSDAAEPVMTILGWGLLVALYLRSQQAPGARPLTARRVPAQEVQTAGRRAA